MKEKRKKLQQELKRNQLQLKRDKQELKHMKAIKSKNDKQESIFNTLLSLLNLKEQDNSVQNTIPYNIMYKDGICKVTENFYTKTIQFFDITFQLAQEDDKRCIFENWCDFLNISPYQLSHITNTSPGEGLLIYGNAIIPFVDHFPKDTQLYKIMTTKLSEVKGG